jgi:hypothetical protein
MSIPEFPKPDPDLTQEQALTMILSSIALEEVALSHIINAEGEKIQHILKQTPCDQNPADLNGILAVNQSVTNLLEVVLQNQMILKNKMDKVLLYLPKPPCPPVQPCSPKPPCPPVQPCSPKPPCPPVECCSFSHACFGVIPKTYCSNQPLQWKENNTWGRFASEPGGCSRIQLPCASSFMVGLCLDIGNSRYSGSELEFIISCPDKAPIIKKIFLNPCRNSTVIYKEFIVQMPCSCSTCYASVIVRSSCGMHVRQGRIVFSKA